MHHLQLYYKICLATAMIVTSAAAPAIGAGSGAITDRSRPEPLLQTVPTGPCDPGLAQPNYVPGVDVNGDPVAAADVPAPPVPVPEGVVVPLKSHRHRWRPGGTSYVQLDGRAVEGLVNPPPGCLPRRH